MITDSHQLQVSELHSGPLPSQAQVSTENITSTFGLPTLSMWGDFMKNSKIIRRRRRMGSVREREE
jgi:hypothetical protein